ncbi:MAG TPA: hypothetical protein VFU13_04690 [Steroidobacteraceae bacterium]|nr:hypothetical protein [Steroidobacteraceae bacterium]
MSGSKLQSIAPIFQVANMQRAIDYFGRIAAAGAFVKVPLADRPYGMRDGRVDDADGNSIQLGEPLIK